MINEKGERLVRHHVKYLELHGEDKIVIMTDKKHFNLHRRLRKEGKCTIPVDELKSISMAAARRAKTHELIQIDQQTVIRLREYISSVNDGKTYGCIGKLAAIAIKEFVADRNKGIK